MMFVGIFVSMETVCIERCPYHGGTHVSDCIKFGVCVWDHGKFCNRDVYSVCKEGFHCESAFLQGQVVQSCVEITLG